MIGEFTVHDDNGSPDAANETLNLFRRGYAVEQIAAHQQQTTDTVLHHLARAVEAGWIELAEICPCSSAELQAIETAMLEQGDLERLPLKPLFKQFDGLHSMGLLRCIRAGLIKQQQ